MAFGMTFFNIFDIPVFWPILLVYFIVLMVGLTVGSGSALVGQDDRRVPHSQATALYSFRNGFLVLDVHALG